MSSTRSLRLTARLVPVILTAPLAALGACAAEAPSGPRVDVQVAPVAYPGILDVCFGLTVYNGDPDADAPDTVWSKSGICSSRFGNDGGGDIAYVGPCDADVQRDNYIALALETITVDGPKLLDDQISANASGGDGDADFQNPCPTGAPCYLHFHCEENADTAVDFNLTVIRDAEQGFFDIGVNFEDVFCSAKVDTCTSATEPIALLYGDDVHDGVGRDHTAVAAVACSAGPDTIDASFDTDLLFTTKTVTCDGGVTFTLDPVGAEAGNLSAPSNVGGYTIHYAHYFGVEDLVCGEYLAENDAGDLLFTCPTGTCRISGAGPDNNYAGYGYGGGAAGFGGGYGGGSARGSGSGSGINTGSGVGLAQQGSQGSGFGAAPLRYFDGNNQELFAFVDDDGTSTPPTQGWTPVITKLSCNKTYSNTAIDIENLAGQGLTHCALSFHATALASDDADGFDPASGTFFEEGGLYAAIDVAAVPLTGAGDDVCNASPLDDDDLDGDPSRVTTGYVGDLASANPAFCFHSDNGAALQRYGNCGVVTCGASCTTCGAWPATLSCRVSGTQNGSDLITCRGAGLAPSTSYDLQVLGAGGAAPLGTFTSGAGGKLTAAPFLGSLAPTYVLTINGSAVASTAGMCSACFPGTHLNALNQCEADAGPEECADPNCESCVLGTICITCDPNYFLNPSGICERQPCDAEQSCVACGAWPDTLSCVDGSIGTVVCTLDNAMPDITYDLRFDEVPGTVTSGRTDGSGHVVFDAVDGATTFHWYVVEGGSGAVTAGTFQECDQCRGGYHKNPSGVCQEGPAVPF